MPDQVLLAGHNYELAAESLLPKGRRALRRQTRAIQASDPGKFQIATWRLSGPLGQTRENEGGLGIEHATLEHRYPDLLTSLMTVTTLSLTSADPPGASSSSALGALVLGGRALGGGTSSSTPQTITHIKEMGAYLFVHGGAFTRQINPSTWTVTAAKVHQALVRGAENWQTGKQRIGLGQAAPMVTITSPNSSGATYADTLIGSDNVYANELALGNDRLWMVRADAGNENRLRFTTDDFASASTGFVVGDPGVPATGVGVMGPYTVAGGETGVWSFTDQGTPFNLVRALQDARSTLNGRKMAYQFGWLYCATSLGLIALRPGIANPVGIGSPSMSGFEGWDGRPVAVLPYGINYVVVVWEDSAGTTWRVTWGKFNPSFTDGTGECDWYALATRTNATVRCLGATSTPTNPHIVWGEGSGTLARVLLGRAGRDLSDANVTYSTAGGQWFGSWLMRQSHLRKTVRWARFTAEDMETGDSWQLAFATDGSSTYTNMGPAVTANGSQRVLPAAVASAPTGFTLKPRITQVAGGASAATTPPKLRGVLEVAYDERPDQVAEYAVVLVGLKPVDLTRLRELADGDNLNGRQAIEFRVPGHERVQYGYVQNVEEADLTDAGVIGATVTILGMDF